MSLTIRTYLPSDREQVWNLHVSALEAIGARAPNPASRGIDADFDDIPGVYLAKGGEFLVGLCDGRIVAMGALKRLNRSVAEITRMRVDPQCWRRGYGQAVLDRLQTRALELGCAELWLDTTPIQVAAQHLYLKNGFLEFGRIRLIGYQAIETILYHKTL